VIDLHSRKVVGYAVPINLAHQPDREALAAALGNRRTPNGGYFHSDAALHISGVRHFCTETRVVRAFDGPTSHLARQRRREIVLRDYKTNHPHPLRNDLTGAEAHVLWIEG